MRIGDGRWAQVNCVESVAVRVKWEEGMGLFARRQVCHLVACLRPRQFNCRGAMVFSSLLYQPFFRPKSTASCRVGFHQWLRSGGRH